MDNIPGINNYLITRHGEIFSKITNKHLKPLNNGNGYLYVCLYENKKSKLHYIHRLVAQTYLTFVPNKTHVNHINGNKEDNRVDNLEWCTQQENVYHALKTGLMRSYTPKHGTRGEYINYKCRCSDCKKANTTGMRVWRQNKKMEVVKV